jgi:tetratricopeptide (TPR) repeat protein
MRIFAALLFLVQSTDFSADGLKALEERRYDDAVQLFSKAIEADAKDYSAHFNLGVAYSYLNKDEEGIAEYRKALELKPGLEAAEVNEGLLLFRQKRAAEALPLLEDAASQKPQDFQARYYLAQCQLETGALAKAAENFRGALEINRKSAAAELGLAHALARDGKLGEAGITAAAPHFRQAAQLDAGHRDALLELADLYQRNKQTAEALAIYREFPDDPLFAERAGELMLRNNQSAEAIPALEQAYAQAPTDANRVALAMAYQFSGKSDKALPLFEKAAAAEPGNFDVHMMYGRALRDNKRYAEAVHQFEEGVKLKPTAANQTEMALAYQLNKEMEKALPLFGQAAAANPADFDAHMMYARALRDAKQYPAAIHEFNEAVKIKPDDVRAWSNLASVLYTAEDLPQALAAFDRARQLGENTPGNWFLRAIILDKLKQLKPALEAYRQFLSMSHGENADQEFQARQRARIIQNQLEKH